jgi:hypothetical protein
MGESAVALWGMPGDGGSGPVEGYKFGTTEDYLTTSETRCSLRQDSNKEGRVNGHDLVKLTHLWLDACAP